MKCTTIFDPSRDEEVIIYAREHSELIASIQKLCTQDSTELIGYKDKNAVILDLSDIVCFMSDDNKVIAITRGDRFILRSRLYKLEESLPCSFIRINQSCIANIKMIERFDASVSGTLRVHFKGGYVDYVSRRCMKKVKERFGI